MPQLLIRWSVQKDYITIPKSTKPERIQENADIFDFTISDEDMKTLVSFVKQTGIIVIISNHTFFLCFRGISGEIGGAMVRILARRSRVKIHMTRPNEPDMPKKSLHTSQAGAYLRFQ